MYDELIRRLEEYMGLSGKSQKQVSKETTLSTSVLSQFLKGTYGGNNEEVAKRITQYLELADKRNINVRHVCFNEELGNTKAVLFACNYAHVKKEIALVCGEAGAGKTTALKHYEADNIGVVFVTANSCSSSATAVLNLICGRIGKTVTGRKDRLMSALVSYFKCTERLIIIDEADHLTLPALQAVRNLNDEAGVGIVLSGNDRIYSQMIVGSRSSELQQLKTRIVVRRRVSNKYTIGEFRKIFPGVDDESLSFLIQLSEEESLRTAIKILELAYDLNKTVTPGILRNVKKELTGGA